MKLDERFLEGLASTAVAEGLVDASFAEVDSPIGRLVVVQSRIGLCRIAFAEESTDEVLAGVAEGIGPRIVAASRQIRKMIEPIQAYLEGDVDSVDLPVDLSLVRTDFQRAVLVQLQKVGRGSVSTYGALAAKVGRPLAVRATGTALGRNPIPIVVPCHRILPASGGVGNYGGGAERKRWLLALEGAPLTIKNELR